MRKAMFSSEKKKLVLSHYLKKTSKNKSSSIYNSLVLKKFVLFFF